MELIWTKTLFLALVITVVMCRPRRQGDDLDCSNFRCDMDPAPICGTDGHTYASTCEMEMENKRRWCWIGHYNMVMKVYNGPCDPTTTPPMVG